MREGKARAALALPGGVARGFIEDRGPDWAILIAWNALFSLFPILVLISGILGLVLRAAGFKAEQLYQSMLAILPDDQARTQAVQALEGIKQGSGILLLVGVAGLLWSASSLFGTMETAFGAVYRTEGRPFLRQKLMSILMMLLFATVAVIAVGSAAVTPYLGWIPGVPGLLAVPVVAAALQATLGALAGVVLFAVIYYVVPNRRQRWPRVLPGALLAGLAFEALSLLFPLYLYANAGLNQYGKSFGFLFVTMTFFYFVGVITMLGAELNARLEPSPAARDRRRALAS
jgi:membrane protein